VCISRCIKFFDDFIGGWRAAHNGGRYGHGRFRGLRHRHNRRRFFARARMRGEEGVRSAQGKDGKRGKAGAGLNWVEKAHKTRRFYHSELETFEANNFAHCS
jgi:hypothetical protein